MTEKKIDGEDVSSALKKINLYAELLMNQEIGDIVSFSSGVMNTMGFELKGYVELLETFLEQEKKFI